MKNINLRSNFNVFALSKADAKVVYHEIYEMNAYGKHGITVQDGDVIIDAGANIGLFSINLVERYKNLQIYLFEPVGSIFECLEKNMAHYAGSNHVFLHHFGLSDQPAQTEFEFCPALSMAAGMYGADISQHYAKDATLFNWLEAILQDLKRARILPQKLCNFFIRTLKIPVIKILTALPMLIALIPLLISLRLSTKKVPCELKPLREVLTGNNIIHVDLLKIDVEGAETDVLQGIAPEQWPYIRQLIIEVHDIGGRVEQMAQMLRHHNYEVTIDQEDWSLHRLMNIYTVYAIKQPTN